MLQFTNEMLSLIAQLAGIIFPVGIVIYAFQYPILREGADSLPGTVKSQHSRLRKKIMRLFWASIVTVFYVLVVKLSIFQLALTGCSLWALLIIAIFLLLLIFFLLYDTLSEIGLRDK